MLTWYFCKKLKRFGGITTAVRISLVNNVGQRENERGHELHIWNSHQFSCTKTHGKKFLKN